MEWAVNKFGGTSVASADAMLRVRDIILAEMKGRGTDKKMAVVVSAMGGKPKVTDLLLNSVTLAAAGDADGYCSVLQLIREKHTKAIEDLGLSWAQANAIVAALDRDMSDLKDLLRAVSLMQHENERLRELVSGYGETWSSQLLCALLNSRGNLFTYLNAREVIVVDESPETGPEIMWDRCNSNMADVLARNPGNLVITGFIATTAEGIATTLKRDGSDYSASIFGRLLQASAVNIWTDVDGVMSADPRRVPEAKVLSDVSFNEAMELAYFGAKVIHPKTMLPAVESKIPIFIKNTFNPSFPGTRIFTSSTATQDRSRCVCGFSTVDDIALVNIEGSGMIGVPGVAKRLFGSLHHMGVSVILISQASSEHSISVAIDAKRVAGAVAGIKETFAKELRTKHITCVDVISPCCIVAAVGDGMSHTTGVAGRFFAALGTAGINVLAIAQGCSERNISCVVSAADSARALRVVHSAFLLSHHTISVGVVGCGRVGGAFLDIVDSQLEAMRRRFNCDLRVRAISNSRRMILNEGPIDLHERAWLEALDKDTAVPLDYKVMVEHVRPGYMPHCVIVDCSNSSEVAAMHVDWLKAGIHVVSNNAHATGGSLASYHALLEQRLVGNTSYQYESTVGGGLPVLLTLQNLQSTGDVVQRIEGVVCPFLSSVLNAACPAPRIEGEEAESRDPLSLSEACEKAASQGLLDAADPLAQLSGEDLARRLLILGRELGLELDQADVNVEPLLTTMLPTKNESTTAPSSSSSCLPHDILTALQSQDAGFASRVTAATESGLILRYVASIDVARGTIVAGLKGVPLSDPIAHLRDDAFCVKYETERMGGSASPMVLQGPRGGIHALASALQADLIRVARDLGARDRGVKMMKCSTGT